MGEKQHDRDGAFQPAQRTEAELCAKAQELCRGEAWTIPNDIELVHYVSEEIIRQLTEAGWTEDEIGLIDVAIDDALTNAIVHGNLGLQKKEGEAIPLFHDRIIAAQRTAPEGAAVSLMLRIDPEKATITIKDQGPGFDFAPRMAVDLSQGSVNMAETGRGIFYMRKMFDSVSFEDGGSKVVLVKNKSV